MPDLRLLSREEREANAFLRERFLFFVSSLSSSKKNCQIKMHENTQVSGTIKAVDLHFENMIVENLKTPRPETIKMAILRTSDIITLSYT